MLVGGLVSLQAADTVFAELLLLAPVLVLVPEVDFLLELHALSASAAATPADTRQIALLRMGRHAFLNGDRAPKDERTPSECCAPEHIPSANGRTPHRNEVVTVSGRWSQN